MSGDNNNRWEYRGYWLSQRANRTSWYRTWFNPGTRQTSRASLRTSDYEQAKEALIEWVNANAELKDESDSITLAVIFQRYYEKHGQFIASSVQIRSSIKHWLAFFEAAELRELTLTRQQEFHAHLKSLNLSADYIRRIFADGQSAINRAYKHGEVANVPYIELPAAGPGNDRICSRSDVSKLLAACETEIERRYLRLLLNTTSRPIALIDLQPFQVDFKRRLINLNPPGRIQNKKIRQIVAMTDNLYEDMMSWPKEDGPYLNREGVPAASHRPIMVKIRVRAGLPWITSNILRHTITTVMYEANVPEYEIDLFTGHRRGGTSRGTYNHYRPGYLSKAAVAVDEWVQRCYGLALDTSNREKN